MGRESMIGISIVRAGVNKEVNRDTRSHVPFMLAIIMLMQKSMAAYSWEWDYDGVEASTWARIYKSTPWELNKHITLAALTRSLL